MKVFRLEQKEADGLFADAFRAGPGPTGGGGVNRRSPARRKSRMTSECSRSTS
jgi:hypothetical protein